MKNCCYCLKWGVVFDNMIILLLITTFQEGELNQLIPRVKLVWPNSQHFMLSILPIPQKPAGLLAYHVGQSITNYRGVNALQKWRQAPVSLSMTEFRHLRPRGGLGHTVTLSVSTPLDVLWEENVNNDFVKPWRNWGTPCQYFMLAIPPVCPHFCPLKTYNC